MADGIMIEVKANAVRTGYELSAEGGKGCAIPPQSFNK